MYVTDTIAAIATPPGEGAIAIVRLSGADAERIAHEVFVPSAGALTGFASHKLYHGHVRDPRTQRVCDEVLLALMRGPRSHTGEDIVEIHCHGSPTVVRSVLRLVLSRGARHAAPGEFTRRAFLNGRLDLAQAEGVLELIQAHSEKAARVALGQLEGGLSGKVAALRESLLEILVQIEAAIDFPDEDIVLAHRGELLERLDELIEKVDNLIASYGWGKLIREGVRVCIVGRPNVGKSSLLNALLGEERAIVTSMPGTTRDFIEESIDLEGLPVVLCDTAGMRAGAEGVEQIGVERTRGKIQESDGVLLVLDGSEPVTADDLKAMHAVSSKSGLVAFNKADLPPQPAPRALPELLPDWPQVSVSAVTEEGLDALRRRLRQCFVDTSAEPELIVTNLRHKAALEQARDNLWAAYCALQQSLPPDLVAVDLQGARDSLAELIGTVTNDDVLDKIFSQFCIGK